MKSIAVMVALYASVCLGADTPPASNVAFQPEPADHAELKAVQKSVSKTRRDAANARKEVEHELNMHVEKLDDLEVPGGSHDILTDTFSVGLSGPLRNAPTPVIVRTAELEPKAQADLHEDLLVMSRLLTKTIERETGRGGRDSAMGVVLWTVPGSRRPQSLYLEGYGALFLLDVNVPLVRPETEEETAAEEKPSNTAWEQAKRELYGRKPGRVRIAPSEARPDYDSQQVDNLKNEVLKVLKNASNIRALKPEESVTVVLSGGGPGKGSAVIRQQSSSGRSAIGREARVFAFADSARTSEHESTMTFRVKKADADAFADGQLDLTEFAKRVAVSSY